MIHSSKPNNPVALYCHVNAGLAAWDAERELRRQRNVLEQYAAQHGLTPAACYFHRGASPKDLVFHRMLQGAVRMEFHTILLEHFTQFPLSLSGDIPQIRLFSIEENREQLIGGFPQHSQPDNPAGF